MLEDTLKDQLRSAEVGPNTAMFVGLVTERASIQ